MEEEKTSVREFIKSHSEYFSDIITCSLIATECRNYMHYMESGYIFLIGSYIYSSIYNKPVTWFERRRCTVFDNNNLEHLFRKTLCSNVKNRFHSLLEIKEHIYFLYKCFLFFGYVFSWFELVIPGIPKSITIEV